MIQCMWQKNPKAIRDIGNDVDQSLVITAAF